MNDFNDVIAVIGRTVANHPGELISLLAAACAATLVVAIATDGWFKRRQPEQKPAVITRPRSR
jgi:hypothetical protein